MNTSIRRLVGAAGARARRRLTHERALLSSVLALSSVVALAMLAFRVYYSGQQAYTFQPWNLLLAWIPLWLAVAIEWVQAPARGRRLRPAALALGVLWLLVLPNAPDLLTEFVHLHPSHAPSRNLFGPVLSFSPRRQVPVWFDVMLILCFAWNGLLLGLVSLDIVRRCAARLYGHAYAWAASVVVIGLCGFGISLGRFERWNSWDVFSKPGQLLPDVAARLFTPWAHPRTAGTTILMAGFLLLAYLTMLALMNVRGNPAPAESTGPVSAP